MKIGILTFHFAHNYGAVFQAYGLQEYLRSQGHEVYIIDYHPLSVDPNQRLWNHREWLSKNPLKCISRLSNFLSTFPIRKRRWQGFKKFQINKFNLLPDIIDEVNKLDCLILGSDQIWSNRHTGGEYDTKYFGFGYTPVKISYAASNSVKELKPHEKDQLKKLLQLVDIISVRENHFKNLLKDLTDKGIEVVVDPTILAGRDVFDKIAEAPKHDRPYLLVYEIARHPETLVFAKELAKNQDWDIVEATNGIASHKRWMREDASPEEMLGLIKHAIAVVTTSFHGTALSTLFHTPFYYLKQNNGADIRISNLLSQLGLEDRMVDMKSHVEFSTPDFTMSDELMQLTTKSSKDFLNKSLNAIQNYR